MACLEIDILGGPQEAGSKGKAPLRLPRDSHPAPAPYLQSSNFTSTSIANESTTRDRSTNIWV